MTNSTIGAGDNQTIGQSGNQPPEYGTPEWQAWRDRKDAEYAEEERIPLADCTLTYEPVAGSESERERCVVRAPGRPEPVTSDYFYACGGARSRLEKAWLILAPEKPKPWKKVALLRTLRQAVRECHAQGMPLDFPPNDAGFRAVHQFIADARIHDAAHHGRATF